MALRAQVGTVAPKSASTTLWVALRNNKRY
jgi:hypothetical protein